jgi:uncharacterized protein (TIGR03085 family)
MSHFARAERQALCDLLLEVGPDAPTLCDGWVTADLAAHLVIRERRPDSGLGLVFAPLAGHTEKVLQKTRDAYSWDDLVSRVRTGPPALMRPLDEAFNSVEYFVHHEDVRRAVDGWEPRQLPVAESAALWKRLRLMGRVLVRRAPLGIAFDAPDFGHATLRNRQPGVTVRGEPSELLLLAFGRGAAARVAYQGDELTVERFRHANLGL